jgi:hypothetical protein
MLMVSRDIDWWAVLKRKSQWFISKSISQTETNIYLEWKGGKRFKKLMALENR